MSTNIFVVIGTTSGTEYSAEVTKTWNVRGCRTREVADALAARLNAWCVTNLAHAGEEGAAAREEEDRQDLARYEEDRDTFCKAWWLVHGVPGVEYDPKADVDSLKLDDKTLVVFEVVEQQMLAAFHAVCDAALEPPGTGVLAEDTNFCMLDFGTSYHVENLLVDD